MPDSSDAVLSVSQLNTLAKDILESSFPHILVEGEISNLIAPRSGHIYFSLKDDKAQIRVALFAGIKRRLSFQPEDGQKVLVKGKLSLYSARGDFQLIANMMEPAGEGELRRQFEALRNKLSNMGWFDESGKKPIPELCQHLAVISSPTGAAIRDIIHVLERRFPMLELTVIPSLVQGKEASAQLCEAIEKANALKASGDPRFQFDLILLARGGGSLEDLWPFNEEALAGSIRASELPVMSGVGHETDYTICDWVSDLRAPTPSAAAEILSRDQQVLESWLGDTLEDLIRHMSQKLHSASQSLRHLKKRNTSPKQKLLEQYQTLDFLEHKLKQAVQQGLQHRNYQLREASSSLSAHSPEQHIRIMGQHYSSLKQRLVRQYQHQWTKNQAHFRYLARQLDNLSPLSTLERGYSISRVREGKELKLTDEQNPAMKGQNMITDLAYGRIESTITDVKLETKHSDISNHDETR